MFQRFTQRARKVVVLAQEEARHFNHNYRGTEHLLLGLLREGEGVAARTLASLNVTLDEVREQVESIVGYGEEETRGQLPFTLRSKKVLALGRREALQLGHNYTGTEHLLLGLVRESKGSKGVAALVLSNLGVDPDKVRREVVRMLGDGRSQRGPGGESGAQDHPPGEALTPRKARTEPLRRTVVGENVQKPWGENVPRSWLGREVWVLLTEGIKLGDNVQRDAYEGPLLSVNDRGVVIPILQNPEEVESGRTRWFGGRNVEPDWRIWFFPWTSVWSIGLVPDRQAVAETIEEEVPEAWVGKEVQIMPTEVAGTRATTLLEVNDSGVIFQEVMTPEEIEQERAAGQPGAAESYWLIPWSSIRAIIRRVE